MPAYLRSRITLTIAAIISLTIGTASAAELQYQGPVTLEGTEQFTLAAQAIDQVFRIDVALPSSYGQTDQNYPVVYMMDSNLMFTGVMN
jgi:predicted dienelactone hydrolase